MTKRSNLKEALEWAERLDDALSRRAEIASWIDPLNKNVRVSMAAHSVILCESNFREPVIFDEIRTLMIHLVDKEISMIRNTLEILGVEIDG